MRELGYVEGKNLAVHTRYAKGDAARIPSLVAELVGLNVDVLFVSPAAVPAAMDATQTIPIICATWDDPVLEGYVNSLAQPAGNLTGISWQALDLVPKRLQLLRELLPRLTRVTLLYDPAYKGTAMQVAALLDAAREAGLSVESHELKVAADLDRIFQALRNGRPQALIIIDSPLVTFLRTRISQLALQAKLPTISGGRTYAESGALLTYGASMSEALKQGAVYVDKVLKGAKPRDLPIQQPTKFELVVNLKTAKALGITITESILLRADEVIR